MQESITPSLLFQAHSMALKPAAAVEQVMLPATFTFLIVP